MKTVWLTFLTVAMLCFSAMAESPFNLGLKYGVNSSKLTTNFQEILNQPVQEEYINNYLAGAFARVTLGRVYLQPEVCFNTKGGIVTTKNTMGETVIEYGNLIDYQSIDAPILLGIKLINKKYFNLRVNVGPVFSWVTSSAFVTQIKNLSYSDLKESQMGWQAGIGLDIWFITIDGRFENHHNILVPSSDFAAKNQSFLLSVGVKLF